MKQAFCDWFYIFLGCTIMAAGFVFFINPYNIVPGGIYGTSIVLHNLFPSIQVGTFGYLLDIPLLLISVWLLGSKVGIRTIVAVLYTPFIMNLLSWLAYPDTEALHALDPALLLSGTLDMSDHLILTTLMGATVIGFGEGLVIRRRATTGGTDTLALLVQKYFHIPFSSAIIFVDGVVVAFGLVVIGFGVGSSEDVGNMSWLLSFYSLIAIYVTARVLARVINGSKDDKLLFIISDQNVMELHRYIIKELDRSATIISSSGLYSKAPKEMIFLVVSYKQVASIKQAIKKTDPQAFVIVTDAYDTYGEGFKPLPETGEVEVE